MSEIRVGDTIIWYPCDSGMMAIDLLVESLSINRDHVYTRITDMPYPSDPRFRDTVGDEIRLHAIELEPHENGWVLRIPMCS